jgi:hypothetical protein
MNIKRAVFMAVLVVAIAALAVPLVGLRAAASGSGDSKGLMTSKARAAAAINGTAGQQEVTVEGVRQEVGVREGQFTSETRKALGVSKSKDPNASARIEQMLKSRKNKGGADVSIQSGEPTVLDARSALSSALMTNIGGRDNQFSEAALIADWDGREDCAADREQKLDDFSFAELEIDFTLLRTGISEHTVANGFNQNVYYYGDSVGNLWVGTDLNPGQPGVGTAGTGSQIDTILQVNIPALVTTGATGGFTLLNRPAGDCTDDQVAVTGIAIQPVADLADFGLCGTIGEVVYVSVLDTEGCVSNASNQIFRTRILAFAFTDTATGVAPAGALQVLRSKFSNIAGLAVDDDGSLYYQLVDLIQFTGGAILKSTELCRTVEACGGANPRVNRVIPSIPDPPTLGSWVGTTTNPVVVSGGSRHTNYGGGAVSLFGDIVSLASGPCNVLYAAVSRSFNGTDDVGTQNTEGLFGAGASFPAGTPSMIISFADCSGAFDTCSGETRTGPVFTTVAGTLPVADGFADVAANGLTRAPGVNNFRIMVLGIGPDIRPATGATAIVPGTPSGLLKIDMQIDYTLHSGIAVSEEGTVFVISGGTPAGVGKSPSAMLGEVLCFEDMCPMDRRADFVDLRGDTLPNPPASGGNVGDGDSDRFDHIFWQAPLDQVTITPGGLAGLARGFLRYTNRLAPNPIGPGVALGVTQRTLGDDSTTGFPVVFEFLDPGHQVAGGDDQNVPNRGDDSDSVPGTSLGSPAPVPAVPNSSAAGTQKNGGFEFTFGGPATTSLPCVWNGFILNSNGNLTFGTGDTTANPTVPLFRNSFPRIAPAWTDLNPASRAANLCTFPVQALGFANVNAFRMRWINVPQFGSEACTVNASNTFSVTLYDDGTGVDENTTETLSPTAVVGNNLNDGAAVFDQQEGPTDLRFTRVAQTGTLVGCSPRPEGSGIFVFEFCRMDILGTPDQPVITGFSVGFLDPLNPPGLCETNLSLAAAAADAGTFGVLTGNQIAAVGCNCCIGEGTEPTIFELFNEGSFAGTGSGGEITFARPDFDLRFEGNDAALCTSTRQRDLNRGKICFLGVGCSPPANPLCATIVAGAFVTPTGSGTDLVDALCAVPLNIVGCGFFPNEVTTICQGFAAETGVPLQRPGKTVTTAATLTCDTNGDGIVDSTLVLTTVTPVSCNLITATIPTLAATLPGTGFPAACCGGPATITVTTTFTTGNNNVFGAFTRTSTCPLALGTRAPIVFSVTPSNGDCSLADQDLLISGACFTFTQFVGGTNPIVTNNVTSVFAVDIANPANVIQARTFVVLNQNLIDAHFAFGSANAGKTFLIFVTGPGGTSRNLTTLPAGSPAGCPLGNEQGIQVTFKCNAPGVPTNPPAPLDIAVVTGCKLDRQDNGSFTLDVTGNRIKAGATVTVGGQAPKKIKVVDVEPGTTNPTKLRLIKRLCGNLPGAIVITNPGAAASAPFLCTERCPAN